MEAHFSSVERISAYIREVPLERTVPTPASLPAEWPASGSIALKNLSIRYRDGLPLVLQNVTLNIKAGEKLGIGAVIIVVVFF